MSPTAAARTRLHTSTGTLCTRIRAVMGGLPLPARSSRAIWRSEPLKPAASMSAGDVWDRGTPRLKARPYELSCEFGNLFTPGAATLCGNMGIPQQCCQNFCMP
jgi:hypothetical protein